MQFELFWNIHECTYKSKLVESVYNSHPGDPRNHLLRARSPSLVMLGLPVSSSAWLVFNCFYCSLANHSNPFPEICPFCFLFLHYISLFFLLKHCIALNKSHSTNFFICISSLDIEQDIKFSGIQTPDPWVFFFHDH